MKDEQTRNLILAAVLSLIVLLGWQYFVVNPRVEQQRQREAAIEAQRQQTAPAQATPGVTPAPGTTAPGVAVPGVTTVIARAEALKASPRVQIDTPRLSGSISLKNGRIDDLSLKNYHETPDRSSPTINLFNPTGAANAFFADIGMVGAAGATQPLPGAETVWTQEGSGSLTPETPVTIVYDNGQGLNFRRTYAIDANYMFTVKEEVRNASPAPVELYPYARVLRVGTPPVAGFYILHEGLLGVLSGAGLKEINYADMKKTLTFSEKSTGGWLGITDKYWAAAVIPDQKAEVTGNFKSIVAGPVETYQSDYLMAAQSVAPGAALNVTHRLFAGAKEVSVVDGYSSVLGIDRFDRLIDWGWFYFFTKPLFYALEFFYHLVGNFGLSILIVTVIVKGVFFPLASKSYESMSRMKKIQPEMTAIRERYADDKMKQQQAIMELYKTEKINPVSGCLPVLIQIPVFFSLYKVLFVSIEMRHQPFYGWIHDLSGPDMSNLFNLFGLIPFEAPQFLHLGAWPLIMGVTMFIQMKMNPDPPDPAQKIVFTWMPLLFTFMLASMPAGLVIYWTWNNILSVSQQYFIMRKNGVKVELWDNLRGMFAKKESGAKT